MYGFLIGFIQCNKNGCIGHSGNKYASIFSEFSLLLGCTVVACSVSYKSLFLRNVDGGPYAVGVGSNDESSTLMERLIELGRKSEAPYLLYATLTWSLRNAICTNCSCSELDASMVIPHTEITWGEHSNEGKLESIVVVNNQSHFLN